MRPEKPSFCRVEPPCPIDPQAVANAAILSTKNSGFSLLKPLLWRARYIVWVYCCLGLLLAACEQTTVNTPTPITITIAGATAMQPVLHDLTVEYSRQHPSVLFNWLGGSSATGEERLRAGQIDLAASTLVPTATLTVTTSLQRTPAFVRIPIGLDGLAMIVHPTNLIENLTLLQLHDLFSGRILDWAELGGASSEVGLVSREDGSGSRWLFEQRVMGTDRVSLTAVVMPTSADVVDYVAENPGAIGYVSRAYVIDALDAQTDNSSTNTANGATPSTAANLTKTLASGQTVHPRVRVVQVENQWPSIENIKRQSYFLTQPLFLISLGQPQGWSRQFIDFTLSRAGQAIVERYHARVR